MKIKGHSRMLLLSGVAGLSLTTAYLVSCGTSDSAGGGGGFTIGGTVSGLSGTLVLQNNSADDLSLTADGSFTFTTSVATDATYSVTVKTQPTSQTCSVTSGSGTVKSENITNVSVSCATSTTDSTTGGSTGGSTSGSTGGGTATPIKMFKTAAFNGSMSGRTGVDQRCVTSPNKPSSCPTSVRAFISVSGTDEIRDMPTLYSVPTNAQIQSTNGTKIADDWADLLDGSLDATIAAAGVTSSEPDFWIGSDSTGALSGAACQGWTSSNMADSGVPGSTSTTSGTWAGGSPQFCDGAKILLCLCY